MSSKHPSVLGPVLLVSVKVALAVVLLDFFPALLMAWVLARQRFWGRSVLEALVHLPLILPPTAVGWLLLLMLGKGGFLASLDLLLTFQGAVLAGGVVAFPLFVRPMRTALEAVDPRLEAMARSLGLSPLRAFVQVTLPLAARGIGAGVLLGMGRALGEFGATILVAGSLLGETRTLSMAVFEAYQLHDDRGALQLVGVCGVIAFIIVFCADRLGADRSGAYRLGDTVNERTSGGAP
jgi:molybdate transport system permease protein